MMRVAVAGSSRAAGGGPEPVRLVAGAHVQRLRVSVGVDRDGARCPCGVPVRATRQAISPRLAIRILSNIGGGPLGNAVRAGRGVSDPRPVMPRMRPPAVFSSRHSFGSSQIVSAISTARTTSVTIGLTNASHSSVPTVSSSPNEAAQFENGSGEVLITARAPDLARWLPAASVPPTIAAASIAAPGSSPNTLAASAARPESG